MMSKKSGVSLDTLKATELLFNLHNDFQQATSLEKVEEVIVKLELVACLETMNAKSLVDHLRRGLSMTGSSLWKTLVNTFFHEQQDEELSSLRPPEIVKLLKNTFLRPGNAELRAFLTERVRTVKVNVRSRDRVSQWNDFKTIIQKLSLVTEGGLNEKESCHYLANALGEEFVRINLMMCVAGNKPSFTGIKKVIDDFVVLEIPQHDYRLDAVAFAAMGTKERFNTELCRVCNRNHGGVCRYLNHKCDKCGRNHPTYFKCSNPRNSYVQNNDGVSKAFPRKPFSGKRRAYVAQEEETETGEIELTANSSKTSSTHPYSSSSSSYNPSSSSPSTMDTIYFNRLFYSSGNERNRSFMSKEMKEIYGRNGYKNDLNSFKNLSTLHKKRDKVMTKFICDSGSTSVFFGKNLTPYVANVVAINKQFQTATGVATYSRAGEIMIRFHGIDGKNQGIRLAGIINESMETNLVDPVESFLSKENPQESWVKVANCPVRLPVILEKGTFYLNGEVVLQEDNKTSKVFNAIELKDSQFGPNFLEIISRCGYSKALLNGERLSRSSVVTVLPVFIRHVHIRLLHCGVGTLRNTLKEQGLTIPRTVIENILTLCVPCKLKVKLKKKFELVKNRTKSPKDNTKEVNNIENVEATDSAFANVRVSNPTYQGIGVYPNHCVVQDVTYIKHPTNGKVDCKALSVVIDMKTKLISLLVIDNKGEKGKLSKETTNHLVKWSTTMGVPTVVKTDNGPEFRGIYSDFCKTMCIDQQFGAPYTPQQQGIVERVNGTIKSLLEFFVKTHNWPEIDWPFAVGAVQEVYNVTAKSNEVSPFCAWYGHAPSLRLIPGDEVAVNASNYPAIREEEPQVLGKVVYAMYLNRESKLSNLVIKTLKSGLVKFCVPSAIVGLIKKPLFDAAEESMSLFRPFRNIHTCASKLERLKTFSLTEPAKRSLIEVNGEERDIVKGVEDMVRQESLKKWAEEKDIKEVENIIKKTYGRKGQEALQQPNHSAGMDARTSDQEALGLDQEASDYNDQASLRRNPKRNVRNGTQYNLALLIMKDIQGKTHEEVTGEELRKGTHETAMISELKQFKENDVLGKQLNKDQAKALGYQILQSRWVHSWKVKDIGRVPKSRLVMRGFQDKENVPVFVDIPCGKVRRLAMVVGLTAKKNGFIADVKTAFLQAPIQADRKIAVTLPKLLPLGAANLQIQEGSVHILKKAMYGLKDSPKAFCSWLKHRLTSALGWKNIGSGCFTRESKTETYKDIIVAYVDDLWLWSNNPATFKEITKIVKMDDPQEIGLTWKRYIGIDVRRNDTVIQTSVKGYTEALQYESKEYKKILKNDFPVSIPEDSEINLSLYDEISNKIGKLGWIAANHPGVAYAFGELARLTHKPCESTLKKVNRVINHLKNAPPCELNYQGIEGQIEIRVWTDASLRREGLTGVGRTGHVIQICDVSWPFDCNWNIVAWGSATDKRRHESTSSAEILALIQGLKDCVDIVRLTTQMISKKLRLRALIDAKVVAMQIENGKAKSNPFDQPNIDYVKQCLSDLQGLGVAEEPLVTHVSTDKQKADNLTKYMEGSWSEVFKIMEYFQNTKRP